MIQSIKAGDYEKTTKRDKQTVRLLRWIQKYPGWWHLICTPNDEHMNIKMMSKLIRHLEQEKLYEMIVVLIMVHRNEHFMKGLSENMLLELITDNWNGKIKSRQQIIKGVLEYLN